MQEAEASPNDLSLQNLYHKNNGVLYHFPGIAGISFLFYRLSNGSCVSCQCVTYCWTNLLLFIYTSSLELCEEAAQPRLATM